MEKETLKEEDWKSMLPISNFPKEKRIIISSEMAGWMFKNRNPDENYAKAHGFKNRPFVRTHGLDLMNEMLANTFNPINGSNPIVLNTEGMILDGQHRLWAMWKSHRDYTLLVSYGQPNSAMLTIDTNMRGRTNGDILNISCIPNANSVAAAIQSLMRFRGGLLAFSSNRYARGGNTPTAKGHRASSSFVLDFYLQNSDLVQQAVNLSKRWYSHRKRYIRMKELSGMYLYLILDKKHSSKQVKDFFESVYFSEPSINVCRLLNDYLYKDSDVDNRNPDTSSTRQAYISKAWNYYASGRGGGIV